MVIPEELDQYDLALSEGQHLTELHISFESRPLAGHVRSYSDNHGLARIDQLLDHRVAAHRFRPALEKDRAPRVLRVPADGS